MVAVLISGGAQAQGVQGTVYEVADAGAARAPSPNAFVIVHWTGRRPGFGHYESVCIQAAIGRTDGQGRFAIQEPPPLRSTFFVFRDDAAVAIWKPGLDERFGLRKPGEWTLVPTKLTAEERAFAADGMAAFGCHDGQGMPVPLTDPQGVLADFKKALAAERRAAVRRAH